MQQTPVMPLQQPKSFICSDGRMGTIDIDDAAGILRIVRDGEVLALQALVGTTPPRYVTGSDSVDLDGDTATIRRGVDGKFDVVATCRRIPAEATTGLIHGTLIKLDRMALRPGTRAKVLLVDAARADAPSTELASTQIVTTGNQVPLHFLLSYPDTLQPKPMTYRLQARIEDAKGKLMYITDTAVFVLEPGKAQGPVELKLVRTGG